MNLFSPFSSVDGVFGRCQELAAADLHTYDISSSALQRLRILLQKLAHRGTNSLSIFAQLSFCLFGISRSKCLSTAMVQRKPNKPSCLFG